MKNATPDELFNAEKVLSRHGYDAAIHADQFCQPEFVVVQDPVHRCGFGRSAGQLVLMGYEPVVIRNYDAARRFINARS